MDEFQISCRRCYVSKMSCPLCYLSKVFLAGCVLKSKIPFFFCSLLPLSFWVSEWLTECNDRIRAYNELCWSVLSIWYSPILETSPDKEFSSEYFTEILRSDIFGPSVVKYDILSNNRRSKLHAVIDCLLFSLVVFHGWRRCCFRNCNRSCQGRVSEKKALLRFSFSLLMMEAGFSVTDTLLPFRFAKELGKTW